MLIENMQMAFHAIRANKMRSFLTMLGIIIGIGSVIAIVSIGDTMRSLFADLYASVGLTQTSGNFFAAFPQAVGDVFNGNAVAGVFVVSLLLSLFLPKEKKNDEA